MKPSRYARLLDNPRDREPPQWPKHITTAATVNTNPVLGLWPLTELEESCPEPVEGHFSLGPMFSGGVLEAGVIALIAIVFTVVVIVVR